MHFATTHNNFNPAGGGVLPPSWGAGQSARIKPNKANKPLLSLFRSLGSQSSTKEQNTATKQINRQK